MTQAPIMRITFLGTSSGGGPSETRNCSSLVVDALGDNSLWMVDCAEGTIRQFALQRERGAARLKASNVKKVFITHMHADHIMGLITLLRNVLRPSWFQTASADDDAGIMTPTVEIYGPAGLRSFVRTCMVSTHTRSADKYAVHELLTANDPTTPCTPSDVLHASEFPGRDIRCDIEGFWREFTTSDNLDFGTQLVADAGPIIHRDPCIGYIFREPLAPSRSLVLLGDTYDASALLPLIKTLPGPSPALLVHEATDAYIPPHIDYKANRTPEVVHEKCVERGHSTPDMAGAFAKEIDAQRLVLNHIGSRFPAPSHGAGSHIRMRILKEIEDQASRAWGQGRQAIAATDFMRIQIPPPYVPVVDVAGGDPEDVAMNLATAVPLDPELHDTIDAHASQRSYRSRTHKDRRSDQDGPSRRGTTGSVPPFTTRRHVPESGDRHHQTRGRGGSGMYRGGGREHESYRGGRRRQYDNGDPEAPGPSG